MDSTQAPSIPPPSQTVPLEGLPEQAGRDQRVSRFDHPLLWLGGLGALSLAAPWVPVASPVGAILASVVFTSLYVWLVVRLASSVGRVFMAPPARPLWQVLALTVICLSAWAASEFLIKPALSNILRPYGARPPEMWRLLGLANFTLRPLALVAAATTAGVALSRVVRYPNMLGPLAGVAALIDIWGVMYGGIVSKLITSPTTAPIAQRAMAPLPSIGGRGGAGGGQGISIASVGAGDFLFLGLFFGILWAHRMHTREVIWWIAPLVSMALLAIALGAVPFLPGLLFIGLGAAIPNRKYLRYTREELFALLYAGAFVLILTVALYFLITSRLA